MTLSDQARQLYLEENLSVSAVAKKLGIYYSHAHAAVKRYLDEPKKAPKIIIKPKRKDVWMNALKKRDVDKALLYIGHLTEDVDWLNALIDKEVTKAMFLDDDLFIEIVQFVSNGNGCSLNCAFDSLIIENQFNSLFPQHNITYTESPNSFNIKIQNINE